MAFILDDKKQILNAKWVDYLGHISFLVYFVLCYIYYQERMLNNDAAYYSFSVVNNEDFFVKHGRYISYFTQWLPILIAKLDGSLKAVLQSYSYVAGIYFYLLFLFCNYILKNKWGGVFVIMCLILTMRYKFYAGHTEITYAIAVASTLFIWIITDISHWSKYYKFIKWGGTVLFCALLYIIHPIIVLPLMMLLGYDFLANKRWYDTWAYLNISSVLATFALRFYMVFTDSYESEKVGLLSNFKEVILNHQDYYVFQILFHYLDRYIIFVTIAFALIILALLFHRKYLDVVYFLLCQMVLTIVIISTHSYLRGDIFIMIDGYIAMYGIIVALALFRLAYINLNVKKYLPIISSVLILICFLKIQNTHKFYENRLTQFKQLIKEQSEVGVSKIFLASDRHDWDELWFPWEIPFESLMASKLDSDVPQGTIFIDDQNKGVESVLNRDFEILAFYGNMRFNERFFEKDTSKYIQVFEVPWKE